MTKRPENYLSQKFSVCMPVSLFAFFAFDCVSLARWRPDVIYHLWKRGGKLNLLKYTKKNLFTRKEEIKEKVRDREWGREK